LIDEIRISTVVCADAWLKAANPSLRAPADGSEPVRESS
jgi:hypothetical protein